MVTQAVSELWPESQLRLLGYFELVVNTQPTPVSLPAQRVLTLLAVERRRMLDRGFLAGTLWPDSTGDAARSNLRSALSGLGSLRENLVDNAPGGLRLIAAVQVDFHDQRDRAHEILDGLSRSEDAPYTSFGDDLLPDWDETWLEAERESFRQLRLHVLERLSERLVMMGRYADALEAALMAVDGSPLRESAHRAVIRALISEGNRGEALGRYASLCALLDEELGVEPSFQLDELIDEPRSASGPYTHLNTFRQRLANIERTNLQRPTQ